MEKKSIYEEVSEEIVRSNQFKKTYEELLKLQHIGTRQIANLSLDEIKFLLQAASVFAFANDEYKQLAYKIATILSERYSSDYDQINRVVQYIIINSGQLPVVQKNIDDENKDYFSLYHDSAIPFNPLLFKNIVMKQAINQLPIKVEGKDVFFTDFQSKSFHDLDEGKSISISAPTSAGKSFLLKSYLSKRFKECSKFNVVYIVPTRALISQVQKDFKAGFKEFGISDVLVSSSSEYSKERAIPKKLFVLTQERFHNLLFDADFDEPLDTLIIDEAQKVSDGARGIILEEVIEESIKRNANKEFPLQKIFLSPFTKNPEMFAKMFGLEDLQSEKTKLSPVSQNLLRLDINEKKYTLKLVTAEFDHEIQISEGDITDEERGALYESKNWPLLWAAKKFSVDSNIIYCNSSGKCVAYALLLSKILPDYHDPEIEGAISFLKENVHEDYFLIDCLRKGVAYHHGKIPNHIRTIVEDLFKNKKLKFIFCTNTLLEGVNLPAQNIFISKPKQGPKQHMNRLNFWNLAGRAGRLLKDYYGNIFCINIDKWKGYKPDPNDVEHEIESILESTVINKDREILEYLKKSYFISKDEDRPIEQAITKFIIQEMKEGETNFVENLLKRNPKFEVDKLNAIREEIQNIAKSIDLTAKIIQKNSSINPKTQQKLLEKFRNESPIIPLHPTELNSQHNLKEIYRMINEFFMNKTDKSHEYFAPLTFNWIYGKTISELIKFKIYKLLQQGVPTQKMINEEIENLFKDINDKIMFEYQKFLKCYIDILLYFYEESGYDPKGICDAFPMYLEYGSFEKNVIILQTIGLSRSTATTIDSLVKGTFSDESDCIEWLKQNKVFIKNHISQILYKEVDEIT